MSGICLGTFLWTYHFARKVDLSELARAKSKFVFELSLNLDWKNLVFFCLQSLVFFSLVFFCLIASRIFWILIFLKRVLRLTLIFSIACQESLSVQIVNRFFIKIIVFIHILLLLDFLLNGVSRVQYTSLWLDCSIIEVLDKNENLSF